MDILLSVPQILQKPELPNGCEITSLCQVLRYLGYPADKCELADRYLPRSERWYGADPDRVYMGDPHRNDGSPESGYYCFAGPIVAAARAYLAHCDGDAPRYLPSDLTGSEEAQLIAQLAAGRPVVFWASLDFGDIGYDPCGAYPLPGGGEHRVFHRLHCMTLCGVDDTHFTVADPLNINRRVPRAQFLRSYRQLGRRAVALVRCRQGAPCAPIP